MLDCLFPFFPCDDDLLISPTIYIFTSLSFILSSTAVHLLPQERAFEEYIQSELARLNDFVERQRRSLEDDIVRYEALVGTVDPTEARTKVVSCHWFACVSSLDHICYSRSDHNSQNVCQCPQTRVG